ncbi:MAG: Holliday junction branch migration protein RuvA [Nitrospiraceae bacterium]|nr:Holliday junction branch migration protein RuvA [Nitrospiraceae bacterium]
MIGALRGRLIGKKTGMVLIDVKGVGYEVFVPASETAALPEQGAEVFLHIHTHVKEDAIKLYGFSSDHEKQVFGTLLGVNGVGPRLALNILSAFSGGAFEEAVGKEDAALLSTVPGIGKKTAARIILELRQKLPSITHGMKDATLEDALSALVNLGYRKAEAGRAIEKARLKTGDNDAPGIEGLLREALRELTGR